MTSLLRSVRSRPDLFLFLNQLETSCRTCRGTTFTRKTVPSFFLYFPSSTSFSTSPNSHARLSRLPLSERYDSSAISTDGHGVITVPLHLKKRLEKKVVRENTKGHKRQMIIEASRQGRKTEVVLHCKNSEFNHYAGQSYGKNSEEIPLASKGWGHRKAAGDWFTIKPATKSTETAFGLPGTTQTFEELGVNPKIIERLTENQAIKPTIVQELAIPEILKGTNNLVAAETGCGKTLAYLVPVVQQILLEKRLRRKRGVNTPLAIVLVPSRELADQIYYVATKLTEGMEINVSILQGGNIGSKVSNPPTADIDLLISTVNVASILTTAGIYNVKRVQHVVLDEADTLLDDSFSEDVLNFLRKFPLYPVPGFDRTVQLSLVSATLPRSIETILADVMPMDTLNRITTPGLHQVMAHVPQTFFRMKKSLKPDKLLEIAKADTENKVPLMIFCNRTKTCDWMSKFLTQNNIKCIRVHGETKPTVRKGLLAQYQTGEVDVLVCTDLGSRGINTVRTGHVLNYEFPSFLADYIHRCGRTGRVGSVKGGHVTNFVSRRFEFETVQEIERSVRKEMSLSKVNANIKRLLSNKYGMFQPILPVDE